MGFRAKVKLPGEQSGQNFRNCVHSHTVPHALRRT